MLFISCQLNTSCIQWYKYGYSNQVFIVLRYSKTYTFMLFQIQIIHSYYTLKKNNLLITLIHHTH